MNAPVLPEAPTAAAHGDAVVLLHSSASSARQWQVAIEALRPRREVHAIDFHGHGTRPGWRGEGAMRLADEAALVEPLLERCGGAHVVGHSYGAAVALTLAGRRPALVRSVVAYEPVLFSLLLNDADARRKLQTVIAVAESMRLRMAQGQAPAAAQRFVDFWSGSGAWDSLRSERQQAIADRMPAVMLQFGALFGDPASRRDLARLRMPVLLARGAHTVPVARRIVQVIGSALPTARHEVLVGMDHMGPITHTEAFSRRVTVFLDAHARPPLQPHAPAGCVV